MRIIWLVVTGLLSTLGLGYRFSHGPAPAPTARPAVAAPARLAPAATPRPAAATQAAPTRADSLVRFALTQQGTAYCYAGTSPRTGFDCSGFVQYVFGHFGIATPHATALLIDVGRPVARAQAQPGDVVVFAGTAPGSTTPGHAGIVISALGAVPLRFVHASSARREPGVKVSAVEGSGYETRFLGVRRVL